MQYVKDASGNRTNTLALEGGDLDAPVRISNVAAGVEDNDAVNVNQLKTTAATTLTAANAYTDYRFDSIVDNSRTYTDEKARETLASAYAYTNDKFRQLDGRIDEARSEARQAAAIGLAAASLQFDSRPGKVSASVGGGYWRGTGAFAFGLGYTNMQQNVRMNISTTTAGGKWGVGAGVSFTLN